MYWLLALAIVGLIAFFALYVLLGAYDREDDKR